MAGQIRIPTICVGPVRSHWVPIRISPLSAAAALPAKPAAAAAPTANPAKMAETRRIVFLPCFIGLIREWPNPEVIPDVAPQAVQSLRLDHQEKDDPAAEQDQSRSGRRVKRLPREKKLPAVILKNPAGDDREQGDEDGAENGPRDRAEPADD